MMMASADRSHEFFWRQAARWLARPSPDPVAITVPEGAEPGDAIAIEIEARDAAFAPVAEASVDASLTLPGGADRPLKPRRDAPTGRFTPSMRVDDPGLYRVRVDARRGQATLGAADRWFYVGGDREFADPRLNEGFLRRLARTSGGRYVRAGEAGRIVSWLQETMPRDAGPEAHDVWHSPWVIAALITLLATEWTLRRRWGLR